MNADDLKILTEAKTLKDNNVLTEAEYAHLLKSVLRPSGWWPAIRNAVELASKVAWPVLALLAIFLFYQPLKAKISESEEIGVGSFVLKIRETARSAGNPELADLLGRLSDDAIKLLMTSGPRTIDLAGGGFLNPDIATFRELERHGLFRATEPIERFEAFFWSLNPDSMEVREAPDSLTFEEASRTNRLTSIWAYKLPPSVPDTFTRVRNFTGELTRKGRQAHALLTKVVADQLTACRPGAASSATTSGSD